MSHICLFPGTFDPLTLGHIDIINRALPLFDKIIVAVGINTQKGNTLFGREQRQRWIEEVYKNEPRIEAASYEGLTTAFCKKVGAKFILRGIRYFSDLEYEKTIADTNRHIDNLETIFLTCTPIYTSVASTLVREIYKNGGNATSFLPDVVSKDLYPLQL